MSSLALPADLVAWIEAVTGAPLTTAEHIPGGARKEGWFVGDDLFLRLDQAHRDDGTDPWTVHREAAVYTALQESEVPVPRVLAVHPARQAMLTERVAGAAWFSRISDATEQLTTARDFMTHLAALHRLDPAHLDLPGFPKPTTIPEMVCHELDEMEEVVVRRGGEPDPSLRFTLDWLRHNIPDHDGPVVLVQGDTGPGNFLYAEGKVVAIVDWELAHLGDPMDDIAWLSLRATQEPFTHLPDRLREYEARSGHLVDDDRVRYYRVMAEAKLLVMRHGRASAHGDLGNELIYAMLHRRLWLEAMAEVIGLQMDAVDVAPPSEPTDEGWLYEAMLVQLRDVMVPRIADPLARQRAKGLARVIKYLAAVDRDGSFYEAAELSDLAEILGRRAPSRREGRAAETAAVRAGEVSDADHLRYVWRRIARENELMRAASGALADRHWPPLR